MKSNFNSGALDLIGETPVVKVHVDDCDVFAKVEYVNPTGSHKDRIYLKMIEEAENRKELKPGMTIIEGSTGNAGAACAMVGRLKGYDVTIVMPKGMSKERKQLIRALGADLILTPGGESDQDLALQHVEKILRENPDEYWYPAQFENQDNSAAHYEATAPELFRDIQSNVDAFVAAVGSGGILTGVGQYLKERHMETRIYAVEPAECPTLSEGEWGSHEIQGIGDGFIPEILDMSLLDGVIKVSSEEAIEEAQHLCLNEGLIVGISTGCNFAAIKKLVRKHPELNSVSTILFDTGQKYFTSPLFGVDEEVEIPERDHALDEHSKKLRDKYFADWEIIQ